MSINIDFNCLSQCEQFLLYVNRAHPVIDRGALFADGTTFYRSYEKNGDGWQAVLKFRTARNNVEKVQVVVNEQIFDIIKLESDRFFDFYQCCIDCQAGGQDYYFKISSGCVTVYYNKRGVMDEVQSYYNFRFMPDFKTPDWAKGAVFYQIFVDRFCNGDPSNDVVDHEYHYIHAPVRHVNDWNSLPENMDVARFYGGDLQGVWDKLDYLQDLGVEVIYLNPIFVSPSNHKYDIQDYDYVDPHFGKIVEDGGRAMEDWETYNSGASKYIQRVTNRRNLEAGNQFFADLVAEIHRRGMKVILDGVFNHCGSFNKWMDREQIYEHQEGYEKGAYISKDSPYHSFFRFIEDGPWPYNSHYDGWWGHDTLPKLNYEESPQLEKYILDIARKWVSPPFNIDGWRLDVAADLGHSSEYNHSFWCKFRNAVKEANPEAIILAEHYGDPASWMQGDQWDTVMNYDAFMEPVTWFLTGVEKHSDEYRGDLLGNDQSFFGAMSHHMSRFHHESLYIAMNELSNHDHSRFLTRTNHRVGRIASVGAMAANEGTDAALMRLAVMIQMTWPGAPTIYYGDEAGVCGWTDPDSRRTYPWGHEDQEMIRFHKEMIGIHKGYEAFKSGSIKFLGGQPNVIAYGRFDGKDQIVTVINNHPGESKTVVVPVWEVGVTGDHMMALIRSHAAGFDTDSVLYPVDNGCLKLSIPPDAGLVLKNIQTCG